MGVALVVAVVLAGTAGCSDKSEENSGFVDRNGADAEYSASVQKLTFPAGYTLPKDIGDNQAGSYQKGWGDIVASQHWQCAWEKEWLATYSTDKKRSAAAITELEKAPGMPYLSPEHTDDATRRFFKTMLDKAKLGDPSAVQQDVTANCG